MRTILSLLLIFNLVFGFAQQKSTALSFSVAFQKQSKLFIQEPGKNFPSVELSNYAEVENHIYNENVLVNFPLEVSANLIVKEGWVLYSAIQSPYDQNTWLCLERTMMGIEFNLFLFNSATSEKQIFINNFNSIPQYAFRPVSWSADRSKVKPRY